VKELELPECLKGKCEKSAYIRWLRRKVGLLFPPFLLLD
jgi:hypothetical protein